MKKSGATILLAWAIAVANVGPAASQDIPFIGQVSTFSLGFCPVGWAPTDGRLLTIAQNDALFALIGTTYGGDGQTNFAVPNTSAIATLAPGAKLTRCIALQGIFPSRN